MVNFNSFYLSTSLPLNTASFSSPSCLCLAVTKSLSLFELLLGALSYTAVLKEADVWRHNLFCTQPDSENIPVSKFQRFQELCSLISSWQAYTAWNVAMNARVRWTMKWSEWPSASKGGRLICTAIFVVTIIHNFLPSGRKFNKQFVFGKICRGHQLQTLYLVGEHAWQNVFPQDEGKSHFFTTSNWSSSNLLHSEHSLMGNNPDRRRTSSTGTQTLA